MGGGEHHPTQDLRGDQEQALDEEHAEINVLVTGFGNFPEGGIPLNTSFLIAQRLPKILSPLSAFNHIPARINILGPSVSSSAAPVKVEYGYVRKYIAELHDKYQSASSEPSASPKIDLFLHLGQASGWRYVSVEKCAYKQSMTSNWWSKFEDQHGYYRRPDAAGQTILDVDGGKCPWDDSVPLGLGTGMDAEVVAHTANERLGAEAGYKDDDGFVPVRAHHESGYHCCGFIYYESLAQNYVRGNKSHVLFSHVPGELDEESLKKATTAVCAVIGAAVEDILEGKHDGRET